MSMLHITLSYFLFSVLKCFFLPNIQNYVKPVHQLLPKWILFPLESVKIYLLSLCWLHSKFLESYKSIILYLLYYIHFIVLYWNLNRIILRSGLKRDYRDHVAESVLLGRYSNCHPACYWGKCLTLVITLIAVKIT